MEAILFFLSFLFVFGIVVFVHELGHFIAAKTSGLTVLEFGFGYPPAAIKKKIGDTVYSLNWIPFGGFVKILGEEGEDKKDPKSLAAQSKLVKAKVFAAGVFMNYVLAMLIFSGLYFFGFMPLIPGMEQHKGVTQRVYVEQIDEGTPAASSGLKAKDQIVSINGREIKNYDDLQISIRDYIGKQSDVAVKRDGQIIDLKITPYKDVVDNTEKARLGVAVSQGVKTDNPLLAVWAGITETFRLSVLAVAGIFDFFYSLFGKLTVSEGAVGPVGMAVLTNEMRKLGFSFLLQFTAIISLSLAFLNIMPIPALDGGHLFILLVEKIRGKDVSLKVKNTITLIGFVFMIALMIAITSKDISRFDIIGSVKHWLGL